jgi:hypothetical protein
MGESGQLHWIDVIRALVLVDEIDEFIHQSKNFLVRWRYHVPYPYVSIEIFKWDSKFARQLSGN